VSLSLKICQFTNHFANLKLIAKIHTTTQLELPQWRSQGGGQNGL